MLRLIRHRVSHVFVLAALLTPFALRDEVPLRLETSSRWPAHLALGAAAARAPQRVRFDVWFFSKGEDAGRRAETLARAIEKGEAPNDEGERPPIPSSLFWSEEKLARAVGTSVARAAIATPLGKTTAPLAGAWGFFVFRPAERRPSLPEELRVEASLVARLPR